jgi:hypothetical protein
LLGTNRTAALRQLRELGPEEHAYLMAARRARDVRK